MTDSVPLARGTAARFNSGKHPIKFVPLHLLEDCSRVLAFGAQKYNAWDWAAGQPWSVPYECALRHLAAWYRGEDADPESGLPHLGHVMANLIMLTHYATAYRDGDDRPKDYFSSGTP